ncbi:hypothetical protein D3C75_714580 [compost metagenome]
MGVHFGEQRIVIEIDQHCAGNCPVLDNRPGEREQFGIAQPGIRAGVEPSFDQERLLLNFLQPFAPGMLRGFLPGSSVAISA